MTVNKEIELHNARLVLPDEVINGSIILSGDSIKEIDHGNSMHPIGIDCAGDYLMPGLIEMHTDNLEKYIVPRPGIYWPSALAAIIAHDNQVFNSGITTVFDSIALGFVDSEEVRTNILDKSVEAVKQAVVKRILKADHYLHMRCELPSATVYDSFCSYAEEPLLRLVSVMDHTPGQRQWRDLSKWRTFHKDKKWTDEDAGDIVKQRSSLQERYAAENRARIVKTCVEKGIPVASHDDTLPEHCQEARDSGITISEFPTTMPAARKAKELSMSTIMGAPNMVRGESHSGNVSAQHLAEHELLDGFSSDFMPISLLHAAFELNRRLEIELHKALATVTWNIAEMVHLNDRGSLEVGKKADLLRVRKVDDLPVVMGIWKDGNEILNNGN